MGYLGKISAVVSVNTGDFAAKLNRLKGDVGGFADSTMRSLAAASRSSAKSFGSIYTEVQKLERALQFASTRKLDFTGLKGFEGKGLQEAVDQMRQMHEIASQLSAPLSKVVASVDAMSDSIKSTLHGAMVQAQADVQMLQTKMETVGSVTAKEFEEAERKVRSFSAAAKIAAEAAQGASSMGGGGGFRFKNPGLSDEFNRGGQLFGKVNALPAGRVSSELVKLIDLQKDAAQEAVRLTTAMADSPSQASSAGLAAAQKALESINDSIEKVIQSYADMDDAAASAALVAANVGAKTEYSTDITGIMEFRQREASAKQAALVGANVGAKTDLSEDITGILAFQKREKDAKQAASDKASADAKAKTEAQTLLRLEQTRLQVMTGEAQSVLQLDSTYRSLLARAEKLTAAQKASVFAVTAAKSAMVEHAISEGTDADVASVQPDVAAIEYAVSKAEKLDEQQKEAKKSADDLQDALSRIADSIGDPSQPIDKLKKAVNEANAAIEKMADGTAKSNAQSAMNAVKGMIPSAKTDADVTQIAGIVGGIGTQAAAMPAPPSPPKPKTADDLFGPMIGTAGRQIDVLKGKISATHSEIEKLPIPIQATLIPEIAKVRAMFMALNDASPQSELDDAANAAKRLSDNVKNLTNAQQFKGTFGQFLDDTSVKKYQSQLQAVQSKLAAIGSSAGGKAAQQVDKFRDALADAAATGQIGMTATNEQLDKYIQKIADAAVAEGEMTKAEAQAFVGGVRQAGDIGRGGADKASLALNQAAYAIDDFMSSTGGVEQKIRAISNNLTQMAFVLGGTKGLWISLGAVIGAQVAIAFYKFATSGKSAEDTTKALNDALDKQKNAVAELAGSYRDLAKSMSMSAAAQKGVDNASVLGTVATGNYDNRMARLTGVNSSVVSERAMSAAIQRAMESSSLTSSAGTLIFRNERLKQSQSRERFAEAEARRAPAGRIQDLEAMRAQRAGIVAQMSANGTARALEALGMDPRWQAAFADSAKELEALEERIRATEGVIDEWADSLGMSSIAAAQTAKLRIEAASNLLASAIESGVPGARSFQNQLDSLSSELSGALNDLANASEQTGERRGMESSDARGRVKAVFDRTADLIADTLSYRINAAFARAGSKDVLGQIAGNPRFAGGRAGLVGAAARKDIADAQLGLRTTQLSTASAEANRIQAEGRKRVGDAEQDFLNAQRQTYVEGDDAARRRIEADIETARIAVESQKQAANAANQSAAADVAAATAARDKSQSDAEAADAVDKLAAAAAQASLDIEQLLGRTRKIGDAGLSASEQTADIRQQMFMRRPTEANREARDAAEKQLILDRERVAKANAQLDQRRAQAEMDPVVLKANDLIAGAQEELAKIQAEAAANGVAVDPARVRQLQDVEASARADRDRRVFDMTGRERAAQERVSKEMEGRRKTAEMEQRADEAKATERARVRQGREDAMSTKERQVLEASRSAENMAAAAGEFADPVARTAFIQKYFNNQKEEMLKAGPMGQAENERFNAQMSGPSRQALNASDITTSDGAKELNRLLRGEDSSRDVNFAEMKQQTELLQVIADGIKAATGIAVQF